MISEELKAIVDKFKEQGKMNFGGCGQNPGLPWDLKGVEKYVFT